MRRGTAWGLLGALALSSGCSVALSFDGFMQANAAGTGEDGGGGGGTGKGGDAAASDAGSVPACAAPPPAGAELVAVVSGTPVAPPGCPTGYKTVPVVVAFGDLVAPDPTCAAATCQCAAPGAPVPCALRLHTYDDLSCKQSTGADRTLTSSCSLNSAPNAAELVLEADPAAGSCAASGNATTTSKPMPTWNRAIAACGVDPAAALPACAGGSVPMPPVIGATLCYVRGSGTCAPGYGDTRTFSTTQAVTDARACACDCGTNLVASSCAGGIARAWAIDETCAAGTTTDLGPGCRVGTALGKAYELLTPPTGTVTVSCSARAAHAGTASGANDVTLCCAR